GLPGASAARGRRRSGPSFFRATLYYSTQPRGQSTKRSPIFSPLTARIALPIVPPAMKTLNRFLVGALAVAAPCWVVLRAADSPPRATGRVLVLVNERTVVGQIEQEGDRYRVRREVGETLGPAGSVLYLGDSLEEAYAFLRSRANLRDPDERMRLARWCHLHGLRQQAIEEATAAVEIKPGSGEGQRLLQTVQRTSATVSASPDARPARESEGTPAPPPAIEVSAELMGQFITRVQPVLMNVCASCHMADQGGTFKLVRAIDDGMVNRRATQQNLNAVLAHIAREHWETSPVLVKAVS